MGNGTDFKIKKAYWVARDKSGLLCVFNCKPIRHANVYIRSGMDSRYNVIKSEYEMLFKHVTWENSPIRIDIEKED